MLKDSVGLCRAEIHEALDTNINVITHSKVEVHQHFIRCWALAASRFLKPINCYEKVKALLLPLLRRRRGKMTANVCASLL